MLADKSSCIGCSACVSVCPVNAISMVRDKNEFLYPSIAEDICVSCGKCTEACPILRPTVSKKSHNLAVFCGHFSDVEKNLKSSSGGFASALSEAVISTGGCVYGVCYNEDFSRVVYQKADSMAQLEPMKGSKYVFSELSAETYESIRIDLKSGKNVLFVGCPCEVYAIKKCFNDEYSNLITCELICQGGSSPRALRIFVRDMEAAYNSKVKSLNMRAKRNGNANPYMMMMMMMSGDVFFEPLGNTDFDVAFRNIKRESCYNCRFKMPNDVADFTAGDHIGMSEGDACYFASGVSVIFAHNEKALTWTNKLKGFTLMDESFERAAGIQTCLFNSIEKSVFYDKLTLEIQNDKIKGSAEVIGELKDQLLQKPIFELSKRIGAVPQRCIIWGVGKYFETAFEAIRKYLPDSCIVAIVDKYKTGEKHGISIIKPNELEGVEYDHVFITSVAGQKEAFDTLKKHSKIDVDTCISLVMLPSDIKD